METYNDWLAHHGILGMKWGKRNGPPYPLSDNDRSARENQLNSTSKSAKEKYKEERKNFKEARSTYLKTKTTTLKEQREKDTKLTEALNKKQDAKMEYKKAKLEDKKNKLKSDGNWDSEWDDIYKYKEQKLKNKEELNKKIRQESYKEDEEIYKYRYKELKNKVDHAKKWMESEEKWWKNLASQEQSKEGQQWCYDMMNETKKSYEYFSKTPIDELTKEDRRELNRMNRWYELNKKNPNH